MNQVVILAGGNGTRMQSELPKVLCLIKGVSIIERIIRNIRPLFSEPVILVGHRSTEIITALGVGFTYINQPNPAGTGHAIWCVKKTLAKKKYKNIIVIPGDHPLISEKTLKKLTDIHERSFAQVSLVTVSVPDFEGDRASFYSCGRIIRDKDGILRGITELKDATESERDLREVNVSYYCFDASWLWKNIEKLKKVNKAGEYYLTDMIKIATENGDKIASFTIDNVFEGLGVNNKQQLEIASKYC